MRSLKGWAAEKVKSFPVVQAVYKPVLRIIADIGKCRELSGSIVEFTCHTNKLRKSDILIFNEPYIIVESCKTGLEDRLNAKEAQETLKMPQ